MLHCICFAVLHCPQPPAFIGKNYHCTDDFKYGSKCHRICREGYDIEPGKPRVILCQGKRWRGEFPDCIGKLVHVREKETKRDKHNCSSNIIKWF